MSYHVLVVDDNDYNLLLVEKLLEMEGYQVSLARSGQEALRMWSDKFDLAVLDVMMPEMNGFELCEFIRKSGQNADLPILLLTAMSGENERCLAEKAGANALLTKPFDVEAFKSQVGEFLLGGGS